MKNLVFIVALFGASLVCEAQISVMNVVPFGRSQETAQDAECSIAVNPADPRQLAASAFTWDNLQGYPAGSMLGPLAPIYVTTNGGTTWDAPLIIPSAAGGFPTYDITLHFTSATTGTVSRLYAGILHLPEVNLRIYGGTNLAAALPQLDSDTDSNLDQPHLDAAITSLIGDAGNDHLYVGFNNGYGGASATGKTATVTWSLNGNVASPTFTRTTVEARATTGAGGQDGFSTVPAANPDGTVYAAFYGWRGGGGNPTDIVVVRDDQGGNAGFASLQSGGVSGFQVVTGAVQVFGNMGNQRLGASNMAISVDPRSSDRVYIAWGDQPPATSNQTIHVRMSGTRGTSWSGDLVTISDAVNPAIAINSHGRVALLYQHYTGTRWQTILRRTTDVAGLVFDGGTTLADTDAAAPYNYDPYLGDYTHMIANGRDFYGAFSASNYPDLTNFPNNVTFQRYADFSTHLLYGNAAHTGAPIPISIDPYVFHSTELAPSSDFYVRDWTDGATSGDNGAEPSTHAAFYVTPDVWNRRGTLTGEPFPSDQPANEPAGNGSGNIGDNWAFARIRRNDSTTSESVSAHFVVSPFGTGSNFADASMPFAGLNMSAPDPLAINFAAGDPGPHITDPYPWHLDSVASTHLCLGVQIDSSNDHYLTPGLAGHAPGWGSGTDLEVLNDNNKAQRNMALSTTPARGVGGQPTAHAGGWALIHNAATFARDLQLRYDVPPRVLPRLGDNILLRTSKGERVPFKNGGSIILKNMQPGENRWVQVSVPAVPVAQGEILPINFYELRDGRVVNGFAIGIQGGTEAAVVHEALVNHAGTMDRIAKLYGSAAAGSEAVAARRQLEGKNNINYAGFAKEHAAAMERVLLDLDKRGDKDPFGSREALSDLRAAISTGDSQAAALADTTLLNTLDSRTTAIELAKGNPADILQTVAWQRRLFSTNLASLACAADIVKASDYFISSLESRKASVSDSYPQLLDRQSACFAAAAKPQGIDVRPELEAMHRSPSTSSSLQRVHRDLLLKLETAAPARAPEPSR